jgi:8-oxo-dGTP diphosphatase
LKQSKKVTEQGWAGILFTNGKRVLLLRRASAGNKNNEGLWDIPGGRVDAHETALQGAKRESKEECGSSEGDLFGTFRHKGVTIFLFAVTETFDCELSHEHDDYKWVKIKKLGEYDLQQHLSKRLPKYLEAIQEKFGTKVPKKFAEWLDLRDPFF